MGRIKKAHKVGKVKPEAIEQAVKKLKLKKSIDAAYDAASPCSQCASCIGKTEYLPNFFKCESKERLKALGIPENTFAMVRNKPFDCEYQ